MGKGWPPPFRALPYLDCFFFKKKKKCFPKFNNWPGLGLTSHSAPCWIALHSALHSLVLCCVEHFRPAAQSQQLLCTALYCTVLLSTVLYCSLLYCTALYCGQLHSTVLHSGKLLLTVVSCSAFALHSENCSVLPRYPVDIIHLTALYCHDIHLTALHLQLLQVQLLPCIS